MLIFPPISHPSQVAQLIEASVLTPIHQKVMGSNPAGVNRTFIEIIISNLKNLIILLCSMVTTRGKNLIGMLTVYAQKLGETESRCKKTELFKTFRCDILYRATTKTFSQADI